MGHLSFRIRKQINGLVHNAFPQINFKFIFTNSTTIGSFLKQKDSLPDSLCSNIIYKFNCPKCNVGYIGSSSRWLCHRINEHMGKSTRTGMCLKSPSQSAIREHSHAKNPMFACKDFEILTKVNNKADLFITECLYIKFLKPELNGGITPAHLITL